MFLLRLIVSGVAAVWSIVNMLMTAALSPVRVLDLAAAPSYWYINTPATLNIPRAPVAHVEGSVPPPPSSSYSISVSPVDAHSIVARRPSQVPSLTGNTTTALSLRPSSPVSLQSRKSDEEACVWLPLIPISVEFLFVVDPVAPSSASSSRIPSISARTISATQSSETASRMLLNSLKVALFCLATALVALCNGMVRFRRELRYWTQVVQNASGRWIMEVHGQRMKKRTRRGGKSSPQARRKRREERAAASQRAAPVPDPEEPRPADPIPAPSPIVTPTTIAVTAAPTPVPAPEPQPVVAPQDVVTAVQHLEDSQLGPTEATAPEQPEATATQEVAPTPTETQVAVVPTQVPDVPPPAIVATEIIVTTPVIEAQPATQVPTPPTSATVTTEAQGGRSSLTVKPVASLAVPKPKIRFSTVVERPSRPSHPNRPEPPKRSTAFQPEVSLVQVPEPVDVNVFPSTATSSATQLPRTHQRAMATKAPYQASTAYRNWLVKTAAPEPKPKYYVRTLRKFVKAKGRDLRPPTSRALTLSTLAPSELAAEDQEAAQLVKVSLPPRPYNVMLNTALDA
ncbi:hypothetical protein BXZ70DRAFT_677942 [Cristinia sonorae]|uniref:Uncharacterized protein n=1 Tax=Cristinia sonorae TaxID=1940300 RepID=A0A8K0XSI5_9AGAR|nr:hypothetical protein BXZ70DRAFT_677942 [Cristinia sonorae]